MRKLFRACALIIALSMTGTALAEKPTPSEDPTATSQWWTEPQVEEDDCREDCAEDGTDPDECNMDCNTFT
jgi:hypothetical protein